MAQAGSMATAKLLSKLTDQSGLPGTVGVTGDVSGLKMAAVPENQVIAQNVAPEIIERSHANKYPAVHVFCSKETNSLREKFRTFSGEASMVAEVRVSQDRLDGLEQQTQLYADAVTRVLDQNRGDWGDGVFYGGGYEVSYGPVKHGGRNFLQIAKISFTVDISAN
jgi:hypothetical protein